MCEKAELESMMCQWTTDFETDPPASNARPKFVKVSRQPLRSRKSRSRPQPSSGPAAIRDLGPEGKARIAALIRELAIVSGQRAEFEAKLVAAESEKNALIARRAELEAELEAAKTEQQRQGARFFTEKIDAELLLRCVKEKERNALVSQDCGRCNASRPESTRYPAAIQECSRCAMMGRLESPRCGAMCHEGNRHIPARQECQHFDTSCQECLKCDKTRQKCHKCATVPSQQDWSRCNATRRDDVCSAERLETSFHCFERYVYFTRIHLSLPYSLLLNC